MTKLQKIKLEFLHIKRKKSVFENQMSNFMLSQWLRKLIPGVEASAGCRKDSEGLDAL